MHASQAFYALYRVRQQNFHYQSMALYRRYAHVIVLFMALFGMVLSDRPSLLAEPLLHFWHAPSEWTAGLVHICGWLATVVIWSSIHREFVSGGSLATYSRTLPLGRRAATLVDLSMLALSLRIFLLPFAVACWIVFRSGNPGGADGRFGLYLALIATLTWSTARSSVFGASWRTRLVQAGGIAVLAFPLPPERGIWPLALGVAVLAACVADAATAGPAAGPRGLAGKAAGHAPARRRWPLLRLQWHLVLSCYRYPAALRLLLAALPQFGACWMMLEAGKSSEAHVFFQLACAATTCLTSGFFHFFYTAKAPLQPYLHSTAFGSWRLALAEHVLVLTATAALFGLSLLVIGTRLGMESRAASSLVRAALFWLACLPLFGLPLIQRHKDGILMKFALAIAALLIAFNL